MSTPDKSKKPTKAYAFIDASNLFYGGEKVLGWKVDYLKLKNYLEDKYQTSKLFYYAGIETHGFVYDFNARADFPIDEIIKFLEELLLNGKDLNQAEILLTQRDIDKAKFYRKLKSFGYILKLKPVKTFMDESGLKKKANCDVDLTFDSMRLKEEFSRYILLSGDGDFEIILQYFSQVEKEIIVLSNPERTAKRLKQRFQKSYKSFLDIRESIELK